MTLPLTMDTSDLWKEQRKLDLMNGTGISKDKSINPGNFLPNLQGFTNYAPNFHLYGNQEGSFSYTLAQQTMQGQQRIARFMEEQVSVVMSPRFSTLRHIPQNMDGVSYLPTVGTRRMISPTPSQEQSSYCSSAQSPATDFDWFQREAMMPGFYSPQSLAQDADVLAYGNSGSQANLDQTSLRHDENTPTSTTFQQESPYLSYPCSELELELGIQDGISLEQVQKFADYQEYQGFNNDDGQFEFEHTDSGLYSYKNTITSASGERFPSEHYSSPVPRDRSTHLNNKVLEAYVKEIPPSKHNTPPPQADKTEVVNGSVMDVDDDEASEDVDYQEYSDESDLDFKPTRNTCSRRPRRAAARTQKVLSPNTKSSRISKSTPTKKLAAQRRSKADNSNPRPFACIFSFAGCAADFPNKNEWKRHVMTQHVCLYMWLCDMGSCGNLDKPNIFNRKDLFTQHLRRMHAPGNVKNIPNREFQQCQDWEEKLRALQTSCMRPNKNTPLKTTCPLSSCNMVFEGHTQDTCKKAWDDRMEHIGKHLDAAGGGMGGINHQHDQLFVDWAQLEGIIERVSNGWRMAGTGCAEELDADGEEE
ncbi:hypothetical protein BJ878DRAFT_234658 [Calycina marina]|uniref:C2H2 finger domain-containing protein n=1 Tax=Calycina marina TaxID=1763456 RepID=A0A9P7YWJ1_9HELO|nr:hypothetical protein BJ878DRAFT_234658 [Calycina marina]